MFIHRDILHKKELPERRRDSSVKRRQQGTGSPVSASPHRNQLDQLDEMVVAGLISHNLLPGSPPGLESGKIAHLRALAACPDYQVEAVDLIAEEDKVVERWRASGTHTGQPFFGVPASGKHFSGTGISIYRIAHGKIVEHWAEADFLGLLQQLGALPARGEQSE